ncbi:MAG: hypothetical protein IT190_07465, partial [Microbacteriaceae bacterium]|nr:hypothetical protein [Microbacteriaceae bacterium]
MSDDVRRWSDDQIRRYQAELHNSYARRFEPISKESLRKANLWDELTNMPHPAVDPEVGALLAPTKYTADRAGSRRERIATFLMLEGECSVQGISEETNIRQD